MTLCAHRLNRLEADNFVGIVFSFFPSLCWHLHAVFFPTWVSEIGTEAGLINIRKNGRIESWHFGSQGQKRAKFAPQPLASRLTDAQTLHNPDLLDLNSDIRK